jgi:hypothetical protein
VAGKSRSAAGEALQVGPSARTDGKLSWRWRTHCYDAPPFPGPPRNPFPGGSAAGEEGNSGVLGVDLASLSTGLSIPPLFLRFSEKKLASLKLAGQPCSQLGPG